MHFLPGYGSYTPNTNAGKIFVILYGFVGCAGGILFFNLFLERMITFLAFLLRELYVRRLMSRLDATDEHRDVLIADWKPSIYSVMVCLFVSVVSIGSVAVPTYAALEGWSYVETAYYCFVSFATIGFGDYVAAQGWYRHSNVYVLANIFVLAIGCCFLYSVFNVISIVLKQILNWLIDRMKEVGIVCRLRGKRRRSERALRKASLRMQRERRQNHRRRSSIYIVRQRNAATDRQSVAAGENAKIPSPRFGAASGVEVELTDGDARKLSDDGLISMKDFFTSNQVSLALMQKQLQECAQQQSGNWNAEAESTPAVTSAAPITSPIVIVKHRHSSANVAASGSSSTGSSIHRSGFPAGKFIPGTIGPLAILCDKLGDK